MRKLTIWAAAFIAVAFGGFVAQAKFADRVKRVSAETIQPWPLTVDEVTLACGPWGPARLPAVWVKTDDGRRFGLNGPGLREFGRIDPIWAYRTDYAIRVNLSPLIDEGLALCTTACTDNVSECLGW